MKTQHKILTAMYVVFFLLSLSVLAVAALTKYELTPLERSTTAVFGIVNAVVFSELTMRK
jgi:hypothetical protein